MELLELDVADLDPIARAHMEEALDFEARGLLQDLCFGTPLFLELITATEAEVLRAVAVVRGILVAMFDSQNLKVFTLSAGNGQLLAGYAIVFIPPDVAGLDGVGLHHIFIKTASRGCGAGKALMGILCEQYPNMTLVCTPDLIAFYERFGFVVVGDYLAHKVKGAPITARMYAGCVTMFRSDQDEIKGPLMLFSDNDLRAISKAIASPLG